MYLSLYRKYRPKFFNDVVGQDVIIKTLKNSIVNNNFGHAYMFFGPRGVGKTTVSKIFARSVNCINNNNGECCEKCDNCLSSFDSECVDIIEIDAASNNGVDEIRELKNKIVLVPNKLKYKVYIIDEVHMLSIGAFNALLKTLEEPPEHVIFILATTDPQKVPDTIVSRCQCFSFKPISEKCIIERMKYICNKEKIHVDKNVLELVARYSDGGMRDSLSMLDKLVSYTNSNIKENDFYELNDMISSEELKKYALTILDGDVISFLHQNSTFLACGKNFVNIIVQTMYYLHELVVNYYLNGTLDIDVDLILVEKFIKLINEKLVEIKKSNDPRVYIEILVLNFIKDCKIISREIIYDTNNLNTDVKDSTEKGSELNAKNVENSVNNSNNKLAKNIDEIMKIRMNNILMNATKNDLLREKDNFLKFKNYIFDQKIGYIACALVDADLGAASESGVVLIYKYDSNVEQNLLLIDKMAEVYKKIVGSDMLFSIVNDDVWNEEKKKYISCLKSGKKYTYIEEPLEVFEEKQKSDILNNETIDLFGDVVEIDE